MKKTKKFANAYKRKKVKAKLYTFHLVLTICTIHKVQNRKIAQRSSKNKFAVSLATISLTYFPFLVCCVPSNN